MNRVFFGKKEDDMASKSKDGLGTHLWLVLLIIGIAVGTALEHYWIEPVLNNTTNEKLSECKASLNLVNQEVQQCYTDLEAARKQNQPP